MKKSINAAFLIFRKIHFYPVLLVILSFAASTSAQELTARPDRGIGGKGTQAASQIDSINMQNGGVSLQLPLASLPPIAGGKLSYTLYARYNSKLWNIHREEKYGTTSAPECLPRYTSSEARLSDAGGWEIGGKYEIFFRDARDDYEYIYPNGQACFGYEYYHMQGRFFKPMLRTPDGSEHELRINGYYETYSVNGERDHLKNYYKAQSINTYGEVIFDNSVEMYTTGGTFIKVVVNPPSSPVKWTAYMKDGTQIIEYPNLEQRIKDTNGNSILVGSGFVRDEQTGREIKIQGNQIQYQKVGGEWENVTLVWGTTTIQGKLYKTAAWNPDHGGDPTFQTCNAHNALPNDTISVIREIILPATEQSAAAQKYVFSYNSDTSSQVSTPNVKWGCGSGYPSETYTRTVSDGLGEVSRITLPTGAEIKYYYEEDGNDFFGVLGAGEDEIATNVITKKELLHDGETDIWNYALPTSNFATGGSVTNPDGSTYSETFHSLNQNVSVHAGQDGLGGLVYRTVQSGKVMTERKWILLGGNNLKAFGSYNDKVTFNPAVDTEYTHLLDASGNKVLTSAKKFVYDYNGDLTQSIEYDWFDPALLTYSGTGYTALPTGIPVGAQVLRTSNHSYYNQAGSGSDPNSYHLRSVGTSTVILGALKETTVGGSISQFSYDGLLYGTAPIKGNVTQISNWDSTNSQWINSSIGYDPTYGNVISKTDPKGNVTQIFYEDLTHAMPTKTIVDPQNGSGQQIATTTYDFSTGLPLTSTDINGNVSSIDYTNHLLGTVDPYGRQGTVYSPYISIDGVNKRLTAKTYYEDNARKTRVESDLFNEDDALIKLRESRDQLGRTVLTERNENGASTYTISSETVYKPQERVVMSSNPHRSAASETDGWTRATSDILGRSVEIATFSGAAQPPVTGTTGGNFTGKVTTAYLANTTTVTDQAEKQRRSVVNALGQLIRVDEPNDAGQLDVGGVAAQPTSYAYDVLGNLTQVAQGSQTRTFSYDSLSRLKTATNPELGNLVGGSYVAGTIAYTYDANGNLQTNRDARGIKTVYDYDNFNRVVKRCYRNIGTSAPLGMTTCAGNTEPAEANTPDVAYTYENTTIANSKGRLTKVTNGFSTTDYQSFDKFGRVTQSQQTTDVTAYNPMTYKYNLAGALVEQKYPSGRVVKNVLDNDGDLAIVQSKKNQNAGFFNYADSFTYTAAGAVSSMQFGNGTWESASFNSRLQPTQIALGTVQNGTDKLKLNFTYNTPNIADNNGNVLSQTITVPTETRGTTTYNAFTATQTYTYDSLNRIKDATEMIGTTQQWKQTFLYDRYSNRRFDTANNNTTTLEVNCPTAVCNPEINTTNNRLIGYSFDNAGNTTLDAANKIFIYDGENKQIEVKNSLGQSIGQYFYDGDGKRVKKIVGVETTVFIYDASGKLVAEYSTIVAPVSEAKVSYLTQDHLGSPRINTDANGAVTARHDYRPFGEEIARANYGADDVRKKFGTYERDTESELDFAQARYHNYNVGRFTSPDPMMASAQRTNPQTFNRYTYVINNPLNLTDPTGLCPPVDDNPCQVGDKSDEYTTWTRFEDGTEGWYDSRVVGPDPIGDDSNSASTPPAMGLAGPPPAVPPAVVAPGVGRAIITNAAKAAIIPLIGPVVLIGILAGTTQAPTTTPQPTTTTTDDDEDNNDILYRGVTVGHPGYDEALLGIARPRGGTYTADEHNQGFTDSIYTSWTHSFSTATWFANGSGQGGVVLTSLIPRSRQTPSIDRFDEGEVLVRGTVTGASVTLIKPR